MRREGSRPVVRGHMAEIRRGWAASVVRGHAAEIRRGWVALVMRGHAARNRQGLAGPVIRASDATNPGREVVRGKRNPLINFICHLVYKVSKCFFLYGRTRTL